ncbi:MAG: hypothetical protein IKP28_05640 [Clostridia bacterium]|nr:hypothetical protein [Clostridia bacterium]
MRNKNIKSKLKKRVHTINILILLIVLLVLVFFTPSIVSTARYVYNTIHDNYLSSQDFYFASDKLSIDGTEYQITNNWSGAETFEITINMNSKKNDMAMTAADITYDITCTCSDNIEVTKSKNSGTIVGTDNHGANVDWFKIYVNPKNGRILNNTEEAWVEVTATSTAPYSQELKGKLILEVGSSNIYYEIMDSTDSPYLTVNVVNSSPQSENVKLIYNPAQILLDMTSHFYLNSVLSTTQNLGGFLYLNSVTSNVDSLSTTSVKFYKINSAQNYAYSASSNTTPIISLTY